MPKARSGQRVDLPSGTITLLLSDIQASTSAWDRDPERMSEAVARHDSIFARLVAEHNGIVVESGREGDSLLCVFTRVSSAVSCALAVQRAIASERWPSGAEIRVRIALHTGEAELRDGHYHGPVVYRCARLMATAHGGQTILSGPARDLVVDQLPADTSLLDLGLHALKDLARAERVFQLLAPGLRSTFPSLRSSERQVTNLPVQLTSFHGRSNDLAELKRLIAANRLVTITGGAGLGKTRLALEVAAQLLDAYPGGVWLAEMAPISDAALVPQALASSLGLREMAGQPILQTMISHLRSRQCLVVLDNCEHLVGACANVANALLGASLGLSILATSQERLGVSGEVIHRLAPLSALPSIDSSVAATHDQAEAVSLFIDRARLSEPSLTVTRADADIIAQICQRLDGIPLAIELAAARVNLMALDDLLLRLDDRFRLLNANSRHVLPRHQTLRAAVDWGYDLLGDDERALFRRLSVFTGGFRLDSAEAVCVGDGIEKADIVELLARLVNKSLVVPDERAGRGVRMHLLETLRQYSRDRLREAGEDDLFARQHAAHYLELAESARHEQRAAESSDWLLRLEDEHDNLRAALETSLRLHAERALSLATALLWFWDVHGYLTEGRDWLIKGLETAPARTAVRARATDAAGWLSLRLGDFESSAFQFEESVSIAREVADPLILTRPLRNLGLIRLFQGETEEAVSLVGESLDVARLLDDKASVAGSLLVLALVAYFTGDLDGAGAYAEQSAQLHRELGDEKVVAFLLACLASLAIDRGDHKGAESRLAESLDISKLMGDRVDVAFVLETSASLSAARSEPSRALRLAGAAARLRSTVGALSVPVWREKLEASLDSARTALGSEAAERAWEEGAQMTLEQAIEYAESSAPEPRARPADTSPDRDHFGLTKRELEIAVLVAHGMTNRDVAERLFIATRTVDAHVEHIRNKLGYRSRAQVAAWAAARGLVKK